MRPLHFLAALLLAFAALATEAHAKSPGPTAQFATNFFDAYFNGGKQGLHALAAVEPYLSPRLKQRIASAKAAEKASIAATPEGDKPCLFEGDIFFGVYEGADNFQVTRIRRYQGKRYVRVRLGLAAPHDPYYWEATMVLVGTNTLLLDDVAWDDGTTLGQSLDSACKA